MNDDNKIDVSDSPWMRLKKLFWGMVTDKWWWFWVVMGFIVGQLIHHW